MTTLEEQFALLVADAANPNWHSAPVVFRNISPSTPPRTRTVYSVGEAINQRGQNAKLGTGANRDTSSRR